MTLLAIVVGIATGIVSGFGVGGGSLLVLYLTAVMGVEQYAASGINLLYFLFCAPAALISHIRNKRVEWQAVIWCVFAGLFTSIAAAFVASHINGEMLRRLVGGLLLYIGVREVFFKEKTTKNSKKSDKKSK